MKYLSLSLSFSLVNSYEDFQFYFRPRMLLLFFLFAQCFFLSGFNFLKSEKMMMQGDLTFC